MAGEEERAESHVTVECDNVSRQERLGLYLAQFHPFVNDKTQDQS